LEIDTFLLSCRVIGRSIETAMLAYLCASATRLGVPLVRGRVRATAKNLPARDLFERHGFDKLAATDSDGTLWVLDLASNTVPYPKWVLVEATPEKPTSPPTLHSVGLKNARTN
jgi:predicted enzyme involved in methoxymalonyl-ACP biosynthesis